MIDRIGPYQLIRELGRGGMGVVYLANDTRLDRQVAIKALPTELAADPARLDRFQREAKTLASLNHPNLAGIYGVEEQDGARYLILEYVEGETLEHALDRGPMLVDDAVELAVQIAAGIEAAHDAGVIHRDLKPANIVITSEGVAKVLDFGLARIDDGASSTGNYDAETLSMQRQQHSPTIEGAILGTAAYMSPEQARGRRVDKRTDIWSFGVVLYEMLTGASPFRGETASDSIGAVLHKQFDLGALPAGVPFGVKRVLERCLERDKNQRYRDIGDVRIELLRSSDEPVTAGGGGRRGIPMGWAVAAVVLIGLIASGMGWLLKPDPQPETLDLAIPVSDRFDLIWGIALSPSGQTVAMIAREHVEEGESSTFAVYVRGLSEPRFRKLPGTDRARGFVQFSPSGQSVLVRVEDAVRPTSEFVSVPVTGGPAVKLYEIVQNGLLSDCAGYLSEEEILAISSDRSALYRISTSGGSPELMVNLTGVEDWRFNFLMRPSPDSDAIIADSENRTVGFAGLIRIDLKSGACSLLIRDAEDPAVLANGSLLFVRDNAIWSAPFDQDDCEVRGPARGVLTDVNRYAVDRGGERVVYVPLDEDSQRISVDLVNVDGRPIRTLYNAPGRIGVFSRIALSPDGNRLLMSYSEDLDLMRGRLWVLDRNSGLTRPITPSDETVFTPTWMPDGRAAYYSLRSPPSSEIMSMQATPGALAERLLSRDRAFSGGDLSISPDGRHMLVSTGSEPGEPGIYLYDVGDGESGRAFYASSANESLAVFSPDGRWVAYQANGTGRHEVYVRPFNAQNPESEPIYPVSESGGRSPKWSPDGRTVYYRGVGTQRNALFAAEIETEPALVVTARREVLSDLQGVWDFIPMPDGTFILFRSNLEAEDQIPVIRAIVNWKP